MVGGKLFKIYLSRYLPEYIVAAALIFFRQPYGTQPTAQDMLPSAVTIRERPGIRAAQCTSNMTAGQLARQG